MRFKNFSTEPIEIVVKNQLWKHPDHPESIIRIVESGLVEPGEVTEDFSLDDPVVKIMLKAHPELRPLVERNAWQKILDEIL